MKHTLRTFVAVELNHATRHRAAALIDQLRGSGANVKWVEPHNLHLTLKFLGEVPSQQISQVCRAVEQAVASIEPFEIEIHGAGAFPHASRPRTLWLGTREGEMEMVTLHQQVEEALDPLGYRRERRRFRPHLTVGRVRGGGAGIRQLGELVVARADYPAGRMTISEVVVFSSQLESSGPKYDVLSRAQLGGTSSR